MSDNNDVISARNELNSCEKDINDIKTMIRSLGSKTDEESNNSLTIKLAKIEGLPETATPKFVLQLSSPIEEATLTSVYNDDAEDKSGMTVTFDSVEIDQATLTVTAHDADIPLGSSKTYEVATFAQFDAKDMQSEYQKSIDVLIAPDENVQDALEAVCTISLDIVFVPSKKDQREQLYESLNQASQRRSEALEKMREVAMAARRQETSSASSDTVAKKEPAIRSGFLNKKAAKKEPSGLVVWYNRHLGPNSLIRQLMPIAKNYIIFFGACTFFHFKGQLLALPPPV